MHQLLEKTAGLPISALVGAINNLIGMNYQDGFARGFLQDYNITVTASNQIAIDRGLIYIRGFRILNTQTEYQTILLTPPQPLLMHVIVRINIRIDAENSTTEIITRPIESPVKENIFDDGNGIYEAELCRFYATATGIIDLVRTIEPLDIRESELTEIYERIVALEQKVKEELAIIAEFKTDITIQQNISNANAIQALTNSTTALNKATSIENRANNGEFNGRDGVNAFIYMGIDEPSEFSSLQIEIL